MIKCQNCGQTTNQTSNFCRFCGTMFTFVEQSQRQFATVANYEIAQPRPYLWKTGEFEIDLPKTSKSRHFEFERVQQLPKFKTQPDLNLQKFQPQAISDGFHCPRCQSRSVPKMNRQISTAGWIVFAVLLATIFPLFWIGLLIKEDVSVCAVCNLKFS